MSFLKALFQTNKHKKLSEEWTQSREPVIDGVTFYVRYLGSSLVDDPKSASSTAAGVKRIIHAAKAGAKRPERVSLRVAMSGVRIDAVNRDRVLMDTSIYKISYCSADSKYDQVLAFVASNEDETCECHAFLCSKRKVAEAIAVSIAQAFTMAYECWKLAVETKRNGTKNSYSSDQVSTETGGSSPSRDDSKEGNTSRGSSPGHSPCHSSPSDMGSTSGYQSSTPGCLLLDFDDLTCGDSANGLNRVLPAPNRKHWTSFDDGCDEEDAVNGLTSSLAMLSRPQWGIFTPPATAQICSPPTCPKSELQPQVSRAGQAVAAKVQCRLPLWECLQETVPSTVESVSPAAVSPSLTGTNCWPASNNNDPDNSTNFLPNLALSKLNFIDSTSNAPPNQSVPLGCYQPPLGKNASVKLRENNKTKSNFRGSLVLRQNWESFDSSPPSPSSKSLTSPTPVLSPFSSFRSLSPLSAFLDSCLTPRITEDKCNGSRFVFDSSLSGDGRPFNSFNSSSFSVSSSTATRNGAY